MYQYSKKLLIDIGNSAIKWSINDKFYFALVKDFNIGLLPKADVIFISCVGKNILDNLKNTYFVKTKDKFGLFKCGYKNPEELGVDRYLSMIAVIDKCPNQNILLIDLGTAVTFDLILQNGEHQGGLIMPGLFAIQNSLDKFKKYQSKPYFCNDKLLANDTKNAWLIGVSNMFINSIKEQINNYQKQYSKLKIILSGGDANKIKLELRQKVEVYNNLVLNGLDIYSKSLKMNNGI
jgi:type III pantothenate kinase